MAKIFNNSISALVALRDRLSPEAFERAATEMHSARRVEIYGYGQRRGGGGRRDEQAGAAWACTPWPAPTRSSKASCRAFLGADDVLLVLSNSGALEPINEAVARARKAGTRIIAMCPQRSDLARLADVLLPVDHPDDVRALVPMVSRLMQAVIIDVLVTEVGAQAARPHRPLARAPGRPAL